MDSLLMTFGRAFLKVKFCRVVYNLKVQFCRVV